MHFKGKGLSMCEPQIVTIMADSGVAMLVNVRRHQGPAQHWGRRLTRGLFCKVWARVGRVEHSGALLGLARQAGCLGLEVQVTLRKHTPSLSGLPSQTRQQEPGVKPASLLGPRVGREGWSLGVEGHVAAPSQSIDSHLDTCTWFPLHDHPSPLQRVLYHVDHAVSLVSSVSLLCKPQWLPQLFG